MMHPDTDHPGGEVPRLRTYARAALVCALLAIGGLTLIPTRAAVAEAHSHLLCIACGEFGGVDFLLNVMLFAPLGISLALLGVPLKRVVLIGLGLAGAIEALQFAVIAGRDATISDVAANTLGTLLGGGLVVLAPRMAWPDARSARWLFAAAAIGWVALQFGGGWAVRLNLPPAPWWAQWQPAYQPFARFTGRVLDVRLGDRFLASDSLEAPSELRNALLHGAPITVVTTAPRRESFTFAPLVRLVGNTWPRREALLVAQDGSDLVVRTYTYAGVLRLHVTSARLPDVLAPGIDDTIRIQTRVDNDEFILRATRDGVTTNMRLRRSASWAWVFLGPFEWTLGRSTSVLTGIWISAWFALLGYWGFLARRPLVIGAAGAAAALGGLAAAPLAFHLPAEAGGLLPASLGATFGILAAFVIACRREHAARQEASLAVVQPEPWTVIRGSSGHSTSYPTPPRVSGEARRISLRKRTIL